MRFVRICSIHLFEFLGFRPFRSAGAHLRRGDFSRLFFRRHRRLLGSEDGSDRNLGNFCSAPLLQPAGLRGSVLLRTRLLLATSSQRLSLARYHCPRNLQFSDHGRDDDAAQSALSQPMVFIHAPARAGHWRISSSVLSKPNPCPPF